MDAIVLVLGIATLWFVVSRLKQRRLPLPPGPKPWPFVGNAFDMPTLSPWEKYQEWCENFSTYAFDAMGTVGRLTVGVVNRVGHSLFGPPHAANYNHRLRQGCDGFVGEEISHLLRPA